MKHMILVPVGLVLALLIWLAPDLRVSGDTDPAMRAAVSALGCLIAIVLAVVLIIGH